jgi:hypothetical protein
MFEEYIGKTLTKQEIFNTFVGMAVAGKSDSSEYPIIYITIGFIGSIEEADNYSLVNKCSVCYGRPPRKSNQIIHNSKVTLDDMVGVWNSSTPCDGGMQNDTMVLKHDGTGGFSEGNPVWAVPITWYVEDGILHIHETDGSICSCPLEYEPDIIIPAMSSTEYRFTRIAHGAHGLPFHRKIEPSYTLKDWKKEAEGEYLRMEKDSPDFKIFTLGNPK